MPRFKNMLSPGESVRTSPSIREYMHKHPLASISLLGVELNVGSALPDTVELRSIDVPDVKYKYVVVGDHTVLVDPGTRKIVKVID